MAGVRGGRVAGVRGERGGSKGWARGGSKRGARGGSKTGARGGSKGSFVALGKYGLKEKGLQPGQGDAVCAVCARVCARDLANIEKED